MPTLYYLLPIFNEASGLEKLLADLNRRTLPNDWDHRVVAVNDGSTDDSLAILEKNKERYPIDIVSYAPNHGIPTVLKQGFTYLLTRLQADDMVVIMESDGTSDLAVIPDFIQAIEQGADVVIGSRSIRGGAYKNFPLERKLGSIVTNLFLRLKWRLPVVTDYTIFYRAYRGRVLKDYIQAGVSFQSQKSFAANGELLLRLSRYTKNFAEVPLQYDYGLKKGKSKMKLFGTLWEYLKIKR